MSGGPWAMCVLCVCAGVFGFWKRFSPVVCARSSVGHTSVAVETPDMPVFNLVPAGFLVLRAIGSICKGHIILPVLLQVPSRPAIRGGPPPGGCGLMMSVVWRGPGLCPVHVNSHSPCPGVTEGLCCMLRF